MTIELRKETYFSSFLNPGSSAVTRVPVEIRADPLSGGRVRILPSKGFQLRTHDWTPYVEESRQRFCPFCPAVLEDVTPRFPADLLPEGRLRAGGATVIPNMNPYDLYAAVVVMSPSHYVPPEALGPALTEALTAAVRFLERVASYDPERAVYTSVNWNYMPYSGSSIIHPHLQVVAGPTAGRYQGDQLAGEERYFRESGRFFWDDLMQQEEAAGERYLGRTGSVRWLSSWAPRSLVDIAAVLPCAGMEGLLGCLPDLVRGFGQVMAFFQAVNIASFNAALHLAGGAGHRVTFRIGGRFTTFPVAGSDVTFLQLFHGEPWTPWEPERAAEAARAFFPDR